MATSSEPGPLPFAGIRVVVVGHATVDEVVQDELWKRHRSAKRHTSANELRIGGKALNQAIAAARLGASVELVTAVGTDQPGVAIQGFLTDEGVGTQMIVRCGDGRAGPVPTVVVRLTEGRYGDRLVQVEQSLRMRSCFDAAVSRAVDAVSRADVLIATFEFGAKPLRPLWKELSRLREAATEACPVVVLNPAPDLDHIEAPLVSAMRLADVVVPNRREAAALLHPEVPDRDWRVAAHDIAHQYGPDYVVITEGSEGCSWSSNSGAGTGSISAVNVDLVDKVGASDVFVAAIGLAFRRTRDISTSVYFANMAAALSVERRGGATSAPSFAEVQKRTAAFRGKGAQEYRHALATLFEAT
jgi:ribokinase